jgi:hypothetical protein
LALHLNLDEESPDQMEEDQLLEHNNRFGRENSSMAGGLEANVQVDSTPVVSSEAAGARSSFNTGAYNHEKDTPMPGGEDSDVSDVSIGGKESSSADAMDRCGMVFLA